MASQSGKTWRARDPKSIRDFADVIVTGSARRARFGIYSDAHEFRPTAWKRIAIARMVNAP
jgi:hypothetical protein